MPVHSSVTNTHARPDASSGGSSARRPGRSPRTTPPRCSRASVQPARPRDWGNLNQDAILARYRPGTADPMDVLEVLIKLNNARHTALLKTVSHKTRQERADFLRRFFRDLKQRAGFKTLPDPRHLGNRHVHAVVQLWRADRLKPATIQTYLSFLRGLAQWVGKPGMVREPAQYGLQLEEYQRHEAAERDKSWSAQGVDIDALIAEISAFDRYVGAELRVIRAFALRRKEAVMLRPHQCVVPFESTGLPEHLRESDHYIWIRQGAKNGRPRFVALSTRERIAALEHVQTIAVGEDAHLGDPARDLKQNLTRFETVMRKFGITKKELGSTGHGLRHEGLIDEYAAVGGQLPPVRGGAPLPPEKEKAAREAVARLAGHSRVRASTAYLGQSAGMRSRGSKPPAPPAS